jgi:hypothetical protein
LTASHVVRDPDISSTDSWFVTGQCSHDSTDGSWVPIHPWIVVQVIASGDPSVDDVAVLTTVGHDLFEEGDMLPICPEAAVPEVKDEARFKTYYCPIDAISGEQSFPPLNVSPSEWKPAYALQRSRLGKMWLRGALCGRSSGGVVIDMLRQAVAMHTESVNSTRTIQDVVNEHTSNNPGAPVDINSSVHSDVIDSISESYFTPQVCVILCFSPTVITLLTPPP